mmetsp:Transcript_20572/g.55435  ORF Transcript_20572/g.55435 Transcript_20572/m.55435 type:complete len:246 (+) Transcript_20572:1016-1753(+)
MATWVAFLRPSAPIMMQYMYEMGRMEAEPQGAAATAPKAWSLPRPSEPSLTRGLPGRNGARWLLTPIGPTPGPPPPCGMQKVLWRLRWHTSAPKSPGRQRPTCAFMLAPSMYTWPPFWCTMSQISWMPSSNTPCVDGYVTMSEESLSACLVALARRSSMSMLPSSSQPMGTTRRPHMTAEAGLVPWADTGMMHTSLWPSPLATWKARMARRPEYSPMAPELGWRDTESKPVTSERMASKFLKSSR